ncbi:hypothetical protein Lupro_05830 [Lutibacter profundi]|uniref:Uncharacterized protein n=1 Tax=Lutibacter profundi TaxID=1622118 RepID=A0A0X8G693_9FLAO|nr:hypothetical protein [Lutibacter profundi]AMC10788.1 hypothetical protein Lupro_05830 [Lutibacter profundi]
MKSLISILIFILFFSTTLFSQQRGNHGNSSQKAMPQKINPKNMAGIISYDFDEVIKKLKIKETPIKNIVSKAITTHNNKINELKTFNYEIFNNVKSFLTKKRNEAKLSRDFTIMTEARMKANEMLAPIRDKVITQKSILNTTLKKELSEKQFKKWLKYQQGKLKELKPKNTQQSMQSAQNRQQIQRNGQRNRQRQSMNGRRY